MSMFRTSDLEAPIVTIETLFPPPNICAPQIMNPIHSDDTTSC
jgi:hypothetical protein